MKTIILNEVFDNSIFTRNSISNFFKKINKLEEQNISLDFKKISFISRSCIDEYIKQKMSSPKFFHEINISKEVYEMFRNVEKQYKNLNLEISFEFTPNSQSINA